MLPNSALVSHGSARRTFAKEGEIVFMSKFSRWAGHQGAVSYASLGEKSAKPHPFAYVGEKPVGRPYEEVLGEWKADRRLWTAGKGPNPGPKP